VRSIPAGWRWEPFGSVANVASHLVDPAEFASLPHIAPNHIESHTGRLLPYTTVAADGVTSPKHLFRPGQILYSKIRPYLTKAVYVEFSGLCSADMYPIVTQLDPKYLLYWMLSPEFTQMAAQHQGRSVLPKINREALSQLPIPVPPAAEQVRIAYALAEHFSRLDQAEQLLRAARRRADRMRRSVLAAITPPNGPWTTLGAIADIVGGVTKDSKRQTDPSLVEVPYLRVANVQRGYLDLRDVTTIRVPPQKAKALQLELGDILFNEGGDRDKLGRGWVWQGEIVRCIHQNHVFRARLLTSRFEPRYISFHGNTFGQRWFEQMGKQTTNLASINLTTLKAFPVPDLPVDEQRRIVDDVEQKLTVLDSLTSAVDHASVHSAYLRRGILGLAFAGQLVPQDYSDEPASEPLRGLAPAQMRSEEGGGHERP
jgi:type I restriction enzyme S subunit